MARLAGRLRSSTSSPSGAVLSELSNPSRPDVLAWLAACKISSNRAAPSLLRLVGVTRPLDVLAASDDDVLVPELELPMMSTLPDKVLLSESDTLLIKEEE